MLAKVYLAYIFDCPFTCQPLWPDLSSPWPALTSRLINLLFVKVDISVYKCVKKTEHSHRTELVSVETKFCSRCKLIADQKSLPTQSKL